MNINDLFNRINDMEHLFLNHKQIILHFIIIQIITKQILLELNNPQNFPANLNNALLLKILNDIPRPPFPLHQRLYYLLRVHLER